MYNILVLNGPNLNLLGKRENDIYGNKKLSKIILDLKNIVKTKNILLTDFQTNSESLLINKIHKSYKKIDYIIINPGAFAHTSIALRDSLLSVKIPFIEVHISNIFSRENFRHKSYISNISNGIICGFGTYGYFLALKYILKIYSK
ncbi:3-dehydroquinate dehydratase [Candidatus Annandia adelgestsuga]|uniref:3-dehydroquinate dehydratase n=1 Tax=Candidatus Annandia adelgestsuga TaxID=1302411 RepID=A0A3S9J7N6_9ENTR|nr:type II 3-dehydroquinate dehydratase [Candidatus Annandia adelgestsuga]AZP36296.1 3-dehydroquinate dehydratase [Candidatus Annandia adelgestsuga]